MRRSLMVATGCLSLLLGLLLIARPFRSVDVLIWLTSGALASIGLGDFLRARFTKRPRVTVLVATVLVVAAISIVVWPALSIFALAILAGVVLVGRGLLAIVESFDPQADDRLTTGVTGFAGVLIGGVALTWPSVTVLVLAAGFGLATVVIGIRQIQIGLRVHARRSADSGTAPVQPTLRSPRSPRSRWIRTVGAFAALVVALGVTAVSVTINRARPDRPDAFYTPPSPLPSGPPGTIIRSEIIDGFQPAATTTRVLYLSTGFDGAPTAVSGLIIVPDTPAPAGGRKIIGYSHGTVGVASRCAPSMQGDVWADFMRLEGLDAFIDAGYVVAATDYQGLGTKGPHPYLVGVSEGMNELDAVRAARTMPDAEASSTVGLWGHSQGGHAALFGGQIAASYAPELDVVGVAAGAPAPDLVQLFQQNIDSPVGRILIAGALQAWSEVYDDATLDQIVTPVARPIVRKLAENCLFTSLQIIGSVPAALALELTFLSNPPWDTEPWATIVQANNPGNTPLGVPVLLTQGTGDVIVPPSATEALRERLCAGGDLVELDLLSGVGHVDGGPAAVSTVAAWMQARFEGVPPVTDCRPPAANFRPADSRRSALDGAPIS